MLLKWEQIFQIVYQPRLSLSFHNILNYDINGQR